MSRAARGIAIAPIVVYRRLISPAIPLEAIRTFGVARGLVLAAWRLLRCNPFSYGGYDPVVAQKLFGARRPRKA